MNTMLIGLRAPLASTGTFLALLLFFAATILAKKHQQQWGDASATSCSNTVPLSISPSCPIDGDKHEIEHSQLLKRIDRTKGKWDKNHPRWELLDALNAYDTYDQTAGEEIQRFEGLYKHIPAKHKKLLESTIHYSQSFPQARSAIKTNANICQQIVTNGLEYYNITRSELSTFAKETSKSTKSAVHRSHVSQALKHMVRDWSSEGHVEREAAFPYILEAINTALPPPFSGQARDSPYSILVPGAGLGSLAHEISHLGTHISVISNEFSSYMNLAYRYLAAFPSQSYRPLKIHPFIEPWSHARTRQDLFRSVTIDSSPSPSPGQEKVLLIEGDFTALFPSHEKFDAVATLFFIDTARNIVSYMEKIFYSLKPGGKWINVGPLLYGSAPFVQLSLDEVIVVAEAVGFVFERRGEGEVGYNFNQSTLYKHGYVGLFWVARRPLVDEEEEEKKGWLW